ncbi:MAG TPA: transglutaminase-like domain-containing protein [Planctomycetota bacterium]|nr:transglutaminase-like domain-containing protein [Planctomycetota bacterium]
MRAGSVAALLLLAAACGHAPPTEAVLEEDWSIMTIMGVRVGHTHSVRTRRAGSGGAAEIETLEQSRMAVKRMGSGIEISQDVRHVETPEGRPLRFSSRMIMSSTPTLSEGVIENGKLKLKTTSGEVTKETESDWDPECLLSEGSRLLMLKKGFAPGTKYRFKTFSADFGKVDEAEIEVLEPETKTVLGKERRLNRVLVKTSLQKGVVMTTWLDETGSAWAMESPLMGLKLAVERTTREEALKTAKAELPEIFFKTMPRSAAALPRPREITELRVRLERPDGGLADWKPPGGTQTVVARDAKSVTLRIVAPPPGTPAAQPVEDQSLFLKSSPAVQSDDPEIVDQSRRVVGEEKDPYLRASALAGWVNKHIDKKSMDVAAASAKEVLKDRTGDCSEHAVLLTALLRASGIPAKVCSGYLYVRGSWGGHAWSSAWVGRWVDLDATLGEGVADAARIKFSETTLEDVGATIEGMTGAGFMHGDMKIDLLEYVLDGKKLKVEPPARVTDNTFSAPLLGFSFEKPADWKFTAPKDLPPFILAVLASPDGTAEVRISYIDLPYDVSPLETRKAARKLGGGSGGEPGRLEGFDTYETESKLFVRLSPGEMLVIVLKDSEAARPALEHIKKTLKIKR